MAGSSVPQRKRRGPGRPFAKGQSGNPSGLPKGLAELRGIALKSCPAALEYCARLVGLANEALEAAEHPEAVSPDRAEALSSVDHKAALMAAQVLLDRGMGKAVQPVSGDGEDGKLVIEVRTIGGDV